MRKIVATLRSAGLLTLAAIVASTGTAADPDRLKVPGLGRHSVGTPLSEVRKYKRSSNCLIEGDKADCAFRDPDGVEYIVLDDSVIAVRVTEKTTSDKVTLPFALHFGEPIQAAIHKLIVGDRIWVVGSDHSGGVTLSSYDKYAGLGEWDFNIEVRFEAGRLVEIKYNSGTV